MIARQLQSCAVRQETPLGRSVGAQVGSHDGLSRGLLVFFPAESSTDQVRAALAVPKSEVMGIESNPVVNPILGCDSLLTGFVDWQNHRLPILRLGDALGLPQRDSSKVTAVGRPRNRLLVFRTPQNRRMGCLADPEMTSIKTPRTIGLMQDCGMCIDHLLGTFRTAVGPLAIPNLDRLLTLVEKQSTAP